MKRSVVCIGTMCLLAGAVLTARVQSQEHKYDEMSPEAMMAMMEKMSQPDEHHANLKPLEGTWKLESKWRMSPDQPWQTSRGTSRNVWLLGGRFLQQELESKSDEGKFSGIGITGYDKNLKKYVNFWIDSMGTGMMMSTGTADASGKVFTWGGEYTCPMTGEEKKSKSVTRIINNDKHVFEMYEIDEEGNEYVSLEVTYTRA